MNPQTTSPLVTAAQGIPGLPALIHGQIIEYTGYIDLNDVPGTKQYADHVRSLIRLALEGDSEGGQGLDYLIDVIGEELAALSYIEVNLDQYGDGTQVVTSEVIPVPDRPLMQHEGVGRGVTAAHRLIEEWNRAVRSGNLDPANFADLAAVRDQLSDLANGLATTRSALVNFESQLP
jgi:hypothetical protein